MQAAYEETVRALEGSLEETVQATLSEDMEILKRALHRGMGRVVSIATPNTAEQTADIEQIIKRLDAGIAEERKAMDALLSRLRTSRIAA